MFDPAIFIARTGSVAWREKVEETRWAPSPLEQAVAYGNWECAAQMMLETKVESW